MAIARSLILELFWMNFVKRFRTDKKVVFSSTLVTFSPVGTGVAAMSWGAAHVAESILFGYGVSFKRCKVRADRK